MVRMNLSSLFGFVAFLLTLIATCRVSCDNGQSYMLTMPQGLLLENQHSIFVDIPRAPAFLRIDTFDTVSGTINVTGKWQFLNETLTKIEYQLPFDSPDMLEVKLVFTINLCSEKVNTVDECLLQSMTKLIKETVILPIFRNNFLLFAETSKPIYKPSEQVQFRLFALYPTNLNLFSPTKIQHVIKRTRINESETEHELVPIIKRDDNNINKSENQFETIYLEDPNKIRMKQWSNISWIDALQLSFKLTRDPVFGLWKIMASHRGEIKEQTFEVKKYVLPRFTVEIKPPTQLTTDDATVDYSVCARYTNGVPLRGRVDTKFCLIPRFEWFGSERICVQRHGLLSGGEPSCIVFSVPGKQLNLSDAFYKTPITEVLASVEEDGTGIIIDETMKGAEVENYPFKIILDIAESYKPGLNLTVKVFTRHQNNSVLPFQKIKVVTSIYLRHANQSMKTDANGEITFILNTEEFLGSVNILVMQEEDTKEKRVQASQLLKPWRSLYGAFIEVQKLEKPKELDNTNFNCPSSIDVNVKATKSLNNKILYSQIVARGQLILLQKFLPRHSDNGKLDSFSRNINIKLNEKAFPSGHVIIYYSEDGPKGPELIADAFSVEKEDFPSCLLRKTRSQFKFYKNKALPGSQIKLNFSTSGNRQKTVCGLRISDVSLETFGDSGGIDIEKTVNELILVQNRLDYLKSNWNHPYNEMKNRLCKPTINFSGYYLGNEFDTAKVFAKNGVFPMTNLNFLLEECMSRRNRMFSRSAMFRSGTMDDGNSLEFESAVGGHLLALNQLQTRIRTFFPETWKFELVLDPPTEMALTIPDSITTWKMNAFCFEDNVLTSISSDKVTVSMPFHINLYLPYSVKRKEIIEIPVKILNSVKSCFEITLHLDSPDDVKIVGNNIITTCVCESQKTVHFSLKATTDLGRQEIIVTAASKISEKCTNPRLPSPGQMIAARDIVKRSFLVVAEGVPEELTVGDILCLRGEKLTLKHLLRPSEKIVEGSERISISFGGDVMGPSLTNLNKLVRMPYGCGEQNMVAMVPSIYVLDYLTATKSNDTELVEKAKEYIRTGYKRQLHYQHDDGSYSAFGSQDVQGSTWLTAFVLKSFNEASRYVPDISSNVLDKATNYLSLQQSSLTGCFVEKGKMFNNLIKGGAKKENSDKSNPILTAYILTALKKDNTTNTFSERSLLKKSIMCVFNYLDTVKHEDMSTYSLSLITYALSIHSPTSPLTVNFQNLLLSKSNEKSGWVYWTNAEEKSTAKRPWITGFAADVETTAYAYLALENRRSQTQSLRTIRWLVNQRNSIGGFYSTQDTVMGLKALAHFAQKIDITERTDIAVHVTNHEDNVEKSITDHTRMVTYKMDLEKSTEASSQITWLLSGTGCINLQSSLLFNLKKPYTLENPFLLDVTSQDPSRLGKNCDHANITTCFSYVDPNTDSNMLLLTVNMISGWRVSDSSLNGLLENHKKTGLKRTETARGGLNLYFETITKNDQTERCITISLEREIVVRNTKAASVTLVDYYNPEVSTGQMYELKEC